MKAAAVAPAGESAASAPNVALPPAAVATPRRRSREKATTVSPPNTQSRDVSGTADVSRVARGVALITASGLALVAAYFSVSGMKELFAGAPTGIMVLAGVMELAKLSIAGYLSNQWQGLSWLLRLALMGFLVGLMAINGCGVYGRLARRPDCPPGGSANVPEDRQIFPTLTVRQNLELGLKRTGRFGRWTFDDMFDRFPNLRTGSTMVPGRSRAASSRC